MNRILNYIQKKKMSVFLLLLLLICFVIILTKLIPLHGEKEILASNDKEAVTDGNVLPEPTVEERHVTKIPPTGNPQEETSDETCEYDLSSIEFMDENNGFVIQSIYNDTKFQDSTNLLSTNDGGINWKAYVSQNCLLQAISFADSKTGLAIATKGNQVLSDGTPVTYQILETEDGGKSWTTQLECSGKYGASCELSHLEQGSAWAVISGTVYRTEDSGNNWIPVENTVKEFFAEHVCIIDEEHGYISGVVKSDTADHYSVCILSTTDGGNNWTESFRKDYGIDWTETIGISFVDEDHGWLLTCNYNTFDGELYRTTNGGKEWELMSSQFRVCRPYAQELEAVTAEKLWIPFHSGAGPIEGGLSYSNDCGKTIQMIGSEQGFINSNGVEFVSETIAYAIMNGYPEKYIMKTEDGGKTWDEIRVPSGEH